MEFVWKQIIISNYSIMSFCIQWCSMGIDTCPWTNKRGQVIWCRHHVSHVFVCEKSVSFKAMWCSCVQTQKWKNFKAEYLSHFAVYIQFNIILGKTNCTSLASVLVVCWIFGFEFDKFVVNQSKLILPIILLPHVHMYPGVKIIRLNYFQHCNFPAFIISILQFRFK